MHVVQGRKAGQAASDLGLIVEVEVPVGIQRRVTDGEGFAGQLLAGGG
jgi:hypothetical protein